MNPSIKQVQAFVTVAQSKTLAEASERIHLSQPALSIALRKLEENVGGPLFTRAHRQLTLTPEGKEFLPVAIRLMNDWTEAFVDLNELFLKKRGKLTLAALPAIACGILPPIIAEFRRLHPHINLYLLDILGDQVTEFVSEGRADLGFSVQPVGSEGIEFESLLSDYFVAICPSGHPLLEFEQVSWEQLVGFPFIGINRSSSSRQDIDRVMFQLGRTLDVLCEVSQIATVGRMVASGAGISVLPALAYQQISANGVESRPLIDPVVTRDLGIITRKRYPLSGAAMALLSLSREAIVAPTPPLSQ